MKTNSFKSLLQIGVFIVVFVSAIAASYSIYKSLKHVCDTQTESSVMAGLYDIIQ
jgi:hypothetical protein